MLDQHSAHGMVAVSGSHVQCSGVVARASINVSLGCNQHLADGCTAVAGCQIKSRVGVGAADVGVGLSGQQDLACRRAAVERRLV